MLDYGYDEPRDSKLDAAPRPQIRTDEAGETYGRFIIEPLPQGYSDTLGNPLRRVLLSSIPGAAVNAVKIDGVEHEYSTIPNVKEDVVDILLNVKAISIRAHAKRPGKLRLRVEGPGEVKAGDVIMSPDFEIVNPELHIATLDGPDSRLDMDMDVEIDRGYKPAAPGEGRPIGEIPVDAVYTPVHKVNYKREFARVGQRTDYERLIVEVWTNGAVSPVEAMKQAGAGLVEYFSYFSMVSESDQEDGSGLVWIAAIPASQRNMDVEKLNLSMRTLNCLKRAAIHKVGETLEKSRDELLRIRNFGEKSLDELDEKLREIGIIHPGLRLNDAPHSQEAEPVGAAQTQTGSEE